MSTNVSPALLRKGKGAAILVLVPVFFTLLFGSVFSQVYVEHIPIAVLDLDQSSISRSLLDSFEDSEGIEIDCYVSSLPELEELLSRRDVYGGLVLPADFGKNLRGSESGHALMLIDMTNILTGNLLLSYANTIFNTLNASLSVNIMEAREIMPYTAEQSITTLTFVERLLYDPRGSYFLYMYTMILTLLIQQPYLSVVTPLFIEKKRQARRLGGHSKLKTLSLLSDLCLYICCSFLGSTISLLTAHGLFGYPLTAQPFYMLLLQTVFLSSLTAMAILFAAVFEDIAHCCQLIMFLSIPTVLLSGYVWQEFMMESWFSILLHMIWPTIYFINPLKDIHIKSSNLAEIGNEAASGLLFACFWAVLASGLFLWQVKRKDKSPEGR